MAYISLRAIREQKGLTIAQLAGKTSISIRTLQAYESGDRPVAVDDLRKLARVLVVSTAEILQPAEPPPVPAVPPPAPPPTPMPPIAVQTVPERMLEVPPIAANGPREEPARGPDSPREFHPRPPSFGGVATPVSGHAFEPGVDRGPRRPFAAPPGAPRPAAPRPMRPSRPSRPPSPATSGQLDQIRNFARRLGLDEAQLADEVGAPLDTLTLPAARAVIAKLRTQMEESGTWRPRVGEGPDQESEYLNRLREAAIPIEVLLFGGEKIHGVIDSFTPYVIQIRQADGSTAALRKLAVVYYRTLGAVDDAR